MRTLLISACLCSMVSSTHAEVRISINYLRLEVEAAPTLSNLDPVPADLGFAGARVGLAENRTTGGFLGHDYALAVTSGPPGGEWDRAAEAALAESRLLVVDAPADAVLAVADLPEAKNALVFNVSAGDARLRSEDCRANLLHTIPSIAMRTDALMQFLVKKRWGDLVMVTGQHAADQAYARALAASAEKFGLAIASTKVWAFDADMRRNAAQEVPLFTQDLGAYDVLLVADEVGDFGRYLLYNTWQARPVAGSEGLSPVAWSPVVEQWGAAQLQGRFQEAAGRSMRAKDYAAWTAMRAIGEAVTRTNSADVAVLRDYLLSDDFAFGGFKGRPMSFRAWNGQLRQPIPIVHPRALVALAPIEGFLHARTELDTLGLDAPQSACAAFRE